LKVKGCDQTDHFSLYSYLSNISKNEKLIITQKVLNLSCHGWYWKGGELERGLKVVPVWSVTG
jgi:hypothetical protein